MILELGTQSPEVARWQTFLGLMPTGIFDTKTEAATRDWQRKYGLTPDGEVGPNTFDRAAANGYQSPARAWYPPRPNFSSPTDEQREQMFGKFSYRAKNSSEIEILGDWTQKNIIKVHIPQLVGVEGCPSGNVYFHRKGAEQLKAFFVEVEQKGLKDLVISWAGAFYPRFVRGSRSRLSNHSFGSAFDINAPENWLNQQPAAEGKKGTLLRLVPIANKYGFFWGGHYNSRLDGMHFELAKVGLTNPFAGVLEASAAVASQPEVSEIPPSDANDAQGVQAPVPADEAQPSTNVEIKQSETVNEDGSKQVDTSFNAPADEAPGILDHVNNLGDRFQGLQGTLDKFGISNPLASTSTGTWFVMVLKAIFSILLAVAGFMKDNFEYILAALAVVVIIALVYDRSRKRVAEEKAGVPVEIIEKVIEKTV